MKGQACFDTCGVHPYPSGIRVRDGVKENVSHFVWGHLYHREVSGLLSMCLCATAVVVWTTMQKEKWMNGSKGLMKRTTIPWEFVQDGVKENMSHFVCGHLYHQEISGLLSMCCRAAAVSTTRQKEKWMNGSKGPRGMFQKLLCESKRE